MNTIATQVASGVFWTLYGSFFEWYWHKLWMHTPRFPREAFRGHTIVHHGLYKGDSSYFVEEGEHPEHILLKPYALPAIVLAHLPVVYLIDRFVIHHTMIGALVATLLYFVTYEYMHWNMHVPRGHFVERFRWFQFLRQHHKLHHKYMQKNFCVLLPLADVVLGTLITDKTVAEMKARREAMIADGTIPLDRKKRRRQEDKEPRVKLTRFAASRLARLSREHRAEPRRQRRPRPQHNLKELNSLLPLGKKRK